MKKFIVAGLSLVFVAGIIFVFVNRLPETSKKLNSKSSTTQSNSLPEQSLDLNPTTTTEKTWAPAFSSSEAKVSFSYPGVDNLEIDQSNGVVNVKHYIPYKGNGLCDPPNSYTSETTTVVVATSTGFDELKLGVHFVTSSINEIFPNFEKDTRPDSFGYSYLEKTKIGKKGGYFVLNAVEMCGSLDYYFPSPSGTLIISEDAESTALRNSREFKNVPGSFSSEQYSDLVKTIVETASSVLPQPEKFSSDTDSPSYLMNHEQLESKFMKGDIYYPQISGLRNNKTQALLNEIIKKSISIPTNHMWASDPDCPTAENASDVYRCSSSFNYNGRIIQLTQKYLSLSIGQFEYAGGAAHPLHGGYSINYDIEKNKELKLKDIFKNENYPTFLANTIRTGLAEKMGVDKNDLMLVEGTTPDKFVDHSFLIAKEGLVFAFDDYEVGPYVAGNPEIVIPYEKIENLLAQDFRSQIPKLKPTPEI